MANIKQLFADNPWLLWALIAIVAVSVAALVAALVRGGCGKHGKCDCGKNRGKGRERRNAARPAVPRADGVVEIYVGNLSYDMKDDQLRSAFAKFGVVNSARIKTRPQDGRSKGFGFVEMPHRSEAELAISKLHNTEIMGRRIRCNEARMDSRPNH